MLPSPQSSSSYPFAPPDAAQWTFQLKPGGVAHRCNHQYCPHTGEVPSLEVTVEAATPQEAMEKAKAVPLEKWEVVRP